MTSIIQENQNFAFPITSPVEQVDSGKPDFSKQVFDQPLSPQETPSALLQRSLEVLSEKPDIFLEQEQEESVSTPKVETTYSKANYIFFIPAVVMVILAVDLVFRARRLGELVFPLSKDLQCPNTTLSSYLQPPFAEGIVAIGEALQKDDTTKALNLAGNFDRLGDGVFPLYANVAEHLIKKGDLDGAVQIVDKYFPKKHRFRLNEEATQKHCSREIVYQSLVKAYLNQKNFPKAFFYVSNEEQCKEFIDTLIKEGSIDQAIEILNAWKIEMISRTIKRIS